MAVGNVFCAEHEGLVVLKFVGDIHYTAGDSYRITASLDAFLDGLFVRGDFDNILIDLTEATSIDSTNLGLLAKITQFTMRQLGRKATILSVNADIDAILESVGFDQVFLILRETSPHPTQLAALPVTPEEKAFAKTILEAHIALSELNEKNQAMFKNVVQLLKSRAE